jgi:hypothetical protein
VEDDFFNTSKHSGNYMHRLLLESLWPLSVFMCQTTQSDGGTTRAVASLQFIFLFQFPLFVYHIAVY